MPARLCSMEGPSVTRSVRAASTSHAQTSRPVRSTRARAPRCRAACRQSFTLYSSKLVCGTCRRARLPAAYAHSHSGRCRSARCLARERGCGAARRAGELMHLDLEHRRHAAARSRRLRHLHRPFAAAGAPCSSSSLSASLYSPPQTGLSTCSLKQQSKTRPAADLPERASDLVVRRRSRRHGLAYHHLTVGRPILRLSLRAARRSGLERKMRRRREVSQQLVAAPHRTTSARASQQLVPIPT
jgi:hypothetical protein